ncbi:MAG: hypothetical protein MUO76_22785 [Anaerolineaceae bacterium]|nr:hypothetical protein [Anaerolineaceae bacterium]
MKIKAGIILITVAILLAGCAGGPSNKIIKDAYYNVFLLDVDVLSKTQCEDSPVLQSMGISEAWLLTLRSKKTDKVFEIVISMYEGNWGFGGLHG